MKQLKQILLALVLVAPLASQASECKDNRFEVQASDTMVFVEGVESAYTIRGVVPGGGDYAIGFNQLPVGAAYDQATRQLVWQPEVSFVTSGETRSLTVTVQLYSNSQPVLIKEQDVKLLVMDRPQRPLLGAITGVKDITNGDRFNFEVEVEQPGSMVMKPKMVMLSNLAGLKDTSRFGCSSAREAGPGKWLFNCNVVIDFLVPPTAEVAMDLSLQAISDGGLSSVGNVRFKVLPLSP
ncbi:MAG: hypothetical protein H6624_06070 [Bdellovibrionaceae bacterium]|nr:hypothetical protein [Bdellovibrionales bacterium]MCB9083889.1 hypothetical protein [Pseudobdellovibrionaceae bacterium]